MCTEFINDGKELGCRWHFAIQEGGRDDGLNDAMMQNFGKKPYSALVRESIQNSLDAVLDPSKPVIVEFRFSAINANNFQNFFQLKDHIAECKNYFNWSEKAVVFYSSMENSFISNNFNESIGYIRISDYNTKGMNYDPNSTQSSFYAFARAAGVSSKIDQQTGGSFGFGKSAYFQLSPIRTVFISTLTNGGESTFEGVSWLATHRFNENKVCSVGYYDNNGGNPTTNFEAIPMRFRRKEPGTSFFILGFKNNARENAINEMIEETLRSFWYAIHSHKLIVRIGDDVEINYDTLDELIRSKFLSDIDTAAKSGYDNPRPYYQAVKGLGNNPNCVKFTENLPSLGECSLFLMKAPTPKDKIIYMRRPLMHVYGKRTKTSYGVFGLFVCTNTKGDKKLQSMENPAHNEWDIANWKDYNGNIIAEGKNIVDEIGTFTRNSIASLFSNTQDTALDITGLDELLYVPEALIDDDNDDFDQIVGKPTGNVKNDGFSLTTDIIDKEYKPRNDNANIGSVRIVKQGSGNTILDYNPAPDNAIGIGGHSKKRSKIKGGKPTAGESFVETIIDNPSGTYKTFLPVRFRVAAQNENGKNYHLLIIHTEKEILNGELEIVTIGEQTDDIVSIDYTNNGSIRENFILEVTLEKGKNIIKILFKDNMRHAIKLKAYENQ